MKTRANSFFKALLMALLMPAVMVSCGDQNKSGSGSSSSNSDPWGGTNANGNSSLTLPSDWLTRLQNEYPCKNYYNNTSSNTRRKINVQSPGAFQVNAGTLHAGVTLEGDILIVSNSNNQVKAELYACDRPGLTSQAQFIKMPILNVSDNCAMAEVTAGDIIVNANSGDGFQSGIYQLAFFPAGMSAQSSLCR